MSAPEGHCWLCNRFGKLLKSIFHLKAHLTTAPLLLMKVDERSSQKG